MKITTQSQNPLEWLAMQTDLIPHPLLQAHFGFMMSKIIWEAVDCGVLEAIGGNAVSAEAVAEVCKLEKRAVTALLHALAGLQIVKYQSGKYTLTKAAKKWLLKDSPESYHAMMLFDSRVCYDWMRHTNSFLKTGQALQYHQQMQPDEWKLYQNGMTAIARNISQLAAKKIKLPAGPATMLDIGGAQGIYAGALLQKYPQLTATVLDLPEAIAAGPQQGEANSRLAFHAGNILTDEIGQNQYDLILMASVAHHFTEAENRMVAAKVLAALKPGGSFYLLEFFRKDAAALSKDMIGALQNFFFAFSSTSGLWNAGEIKSWFTEAGFQQIRTIQFLQLPGFGMVTGKR